MKTYLITLLFCLLISSFNGCLADEDHILKIEIHSAGYHAGNYARVILNNELTQVEKNEFGKMGGLHVVIINPYSGKVERAIAFNTLKTSEGLD